MSDARRYAVWPDPRSRSRSRSRAYSRIKDRKSPVKGSRPSVPHGTNFFIFIFFTVVFIFFSFFAVFCVLLYLYFVYDDIININKK